MSLLKRITFSRIETLAILLFSIIALLRGEITVFYMMYLFWWQTFIHVIVNTSKVLFISKNAEFKPKLIHYIGGNMFLLFLYFIFIVLFFGFFSNLENRNLLTINMQVLFFQNWSFNINLVVFFISALFYNKTYLKDLPNHAFSPRNIILHVSIILGAFIHFFVIHQLPELFDGENLWSSVLVILPFLTLRIFFDSYIYNSEKTK